MRRNFKVTLPDVDVVADTIVVSIPQKFEQQYLAALEQLAGVDTELDRLQHMIVELPLQIRRGEAVAGDLERALTQRQAAGLRRRETERAVADATAARDEALTRARREAVNRANRLRDELQKTADEITPVLDHLREIERALDAGVKAIGVPGVQQVEPLEWPSTVVDEASRFNSAIAAQTLVTR